MTHQVSTKKLNRSSSHRESLFKSMVAGLINNGELTTTEAKAKVIRKIADKLITQAKLGDLNSRRLIQGFFNDGKVTSRLVDSIAPRLKERQGGFTKIIKLGVRRGDNTMMAKLSFVEGIKAQPLPQLSKPAAKNPPAKPTKKTK